MAEINEIVSKEAIDGLVKTNAEIIKVDEATKAWIKSLELIATSLKQNDITIKQVNAAQKSVEKSTTKLTELQKQQISAEKSLEKQRQRGLAVMAKAEAKERELTAAINKEVKSLNDLKAQTNALIAKRNALDKTTVSGKQEFDRLTAAINKNNAALRANDKTIGVHNRNVGNYASALKGVGSQLMGALGVTAGLYGLVNGIKSVINTSKNFETSLSSLSAITGLVGKDLDFFKKQSIELAAVTLKSANEIVKAFELVGSIRPELLADKEALAEVTKQAIILSEATGGKLALEDAARATAGVLNQFGLDSARANDVINVLAAGSKVGAAAVVEITASINKFGAVADAANMSVEQSVGLIETLAEKSITGEEAGTKLRNILIKLQGNQKNYRNGLFDVNLALENYANANKNVTELTNDFGKQNVVAAQILINSRQKVISYTDAVTGTQTALEQQKIQNDNLSGSLKSLGSAWESLVLTINKGGGFLKGAIDQFTEFINVIRLSQKSVADLIVEAGDESIQNAIKADREEVERLSESLQKGGVEAIEANKRAVQLLLLQYIKLKEEGVSDPQLIQRQIDALRKMQEEINKPVEAPVAKKASESEIKEAEKKAQKLLEIKAKEITEKMRMEREHDNLLADLDDEYYKGVDEGLKVITDEYKAQTEAIDEEYKKRAESNKNNLAQQIADEQEATEKRIELAAAAIEAFSMVTDEIVSMNQSRIDRETEQNQQQREYELALAGENKEKQAAANARYEKREKEIKKKQAKADKEAAIYKTLINIATAVVTMLTAGPVAGQILAGLAAAIGAVNLAKIVSTPIPQFYKGTENAPDGVISVGERGRELTETKSGKLIMFDKPTLATGLKGAKIYTNEQTERIMNMAGHDSKEVRAMDEGRIEKAIERGLAQQTRYYFETERVVKRRGNMTEIWANRKLKGVRND